MPSPIRILTAVPICDGHDSAINTINLEFIRHGIEVVYLGFHRYVGDIVRAAIQEDVAAIGISSYNGGHIEFFADVVRQLKKKGADDIAVFGGGGGTITHDDAREMKRKGVDQIFFAGTSLNEMADYVRRQYAKRKRRRTISKSDLVLARKLTELEDAFVDGRRRPHGCRGQGEDCRIEPSVGRAATRCHRSGRRSVYGRREEVFRRRSHRR